MLSMSEIGNEIEKIYSELLEKKKVYEESVSKVMRLDVIEKECADLRMKEKENINKNQVFIEEISQLNNRIREMELKSDEISG